MEQTESRIVELLMKKLKDELSTEDEQILDAWAEQSEQHTKLLQDIQQEDLLLYEFRKFNRYDWEAAFNKLPQKGVVLSPVVTMGRRSSFGRYMVAAAVFLLLAVGAYLFISPDKKKDIVQNDTPAVVVKPGQYKAKLTLADGSTIVLDSAALGKLAQQGNVEVLNKDGKLVYAPSGAGSGRGEMVYNTLTTSKGETYATLLSDGSKIWLNSQSSVRYPVAFSGNSRRVEITGEAYFEIAHNASKPFTVSVNGMEVEVLGTIFNINSYRDEEAVKTTLLEGKVKVIKDKATSILKPGQQAQVVGSSLKVKDNADVDQAVAWKNGFFQFDNDNLKIVMRQLARWYDVEVVYEGAIPDIAFVGKIRMNSKLAEVLTLLEKNDVHFKVQGKRIVVSQ